MSEKEIIRRQEYKKNRKKWLLVQAIALVVAVAVALCSFLVYNRMNKTYYIEYTEGSTIDYQVKYEETAFFDDPMQDANKAYITALIDQVFADFRYEMHMGASNVGFDYSYSVDAKMVVADKTSGNAYYTVETPLIPCQQANSKGGSTVKIEEQVAIDFPYFNDIARSFVGAYELKNTNSTLIVTLKVQINSTCDQFEQSNQNAYSTSINIPLNEETMSIFLSSGAPVSESKVLAYRSGINQNIFLVSGNVFTGLALLLALAMFAYMHFTKNEDITYSAKVRKLLSSYSSFIQRMEGDFDDEGYQILIIKTFNELLGIRDTIQSPILMTENRDQTMSRFLIPTNTKLLYVFEVKVDNYDEIYGTAVGSAQ